jgi:hypothetical protein
MYDQYQDKQELKEADFEFVKTVITTHPHAAAKLDKVRESK